MGNQVAHSSHAAPPLLVRTVRNTHRLDSGQEYRIGRDERADIPLVDARVSWEHAVIRAEGPVWVLEDLGSRNGTFLGSERVKRLEITSPYVVHFGHPEDGPVLRFELVRPDPFADFAHAAGPAAPAPSGSAPGDTTFMPGVLREPTSRVRIQSKVMKIGRRPDNDIVVHDLGVSKQHAELRRLADRHVPIIDLGSHNGTFVNGTRVNQAELKDDDIIADRPRHLPADRRRADRVRRRRARHVRGARAAGRGARRRQGQDPARRDHVPARRAVDDGGHRPGRARASPPCSTR